MAYRGWRLLLCRIGWHTDKEDTMLTIICAYCYKTLEDKS